MKDDMRISEEDEKLLLEKTVNGAPRKYSPVVYRVSADNGQVNRCPLADGFFFNQSTVTAEIYLD